MQRDFRRRRGIDAPIARNIRRWLEQLKETRCLHKGKSTGRDLVYSMIMWEKN